MNVLMVNTVNGGGGAGRGSARLAAALQAAGHSVHAIVSEVTESDRIGQHYRHWRELAFDNWLKRRGFVDCGKISSFLWRALPAYAEADVVHLHNLHGDYLSIFALPLWGWDKPIVWTLHDQWAFTGGCIYSYDCEKFTQACGDCPRIGEYPLGDRDRTAFMRRAKTWMIRCAQPRFITPSRWLGDLLHQARGLDDVPLSVIPYALSADVFAPPSDRAACRAQFDLAPDRPTVIFACHAFDDPRKGAEDAVAAVRYAAKQVPQLQVLVLGRDSDRFLAQAEVDGQAKAFIEDERIVAAAFGAADVALAPSMMDNYPFVVLEALSCATPVVGYAVGGIPEQVAHGKRGLLANVGDKLQLGAALVELLSHPERAAAMGAAGREFICETSDPDQVTQRHLAEYEAAIARWTTRRRRPHARQKRGRLWQAIARRMKWEATPDHPGVVSPANM